MAPRDAGQGQGFCNMCQIGSHGGGVAHQQRKFVEVVSWNVLYVGMQEMLLLAIIDESFVCHCGRSGWYSIEPILYVLCLSMRRLPNGRYPVLSHTITFAIIEVCSHCCPPASMEEVEAALRRSRAKCPTQCTAYVALACLTGANLEQPIPGFQQGNNLV